MPPALWMATVLVGTVAGLVILWRIVPWLTGLRARARSVDAVDPATGFFKSSAQSVWSTSVDGTNIPVGGAANQIPDWNPANTPHRNIYTYLGSNPASPVIALFAT